MDQDGILPEKTEEEKEEDELNQLIAGFNSDTTKFKDNDAEGTEKRGKSCMEKK